MSGEKDTPPQMPTEEEIARAIYEDRNGRGCVPWSRRDSSHKAPYLSDARAVLAIFAPILAEKEAAEEQAESFKAMYRQAVDWRDEKIAKLTTRAEDAEFAMSRVEKSAASAEARALAAEAALAAERERCAGIAERFKAAHFEACGASGSFSVDKAEMAQALCARDIAAAIRARGE